VALFALPAAAQTFPPQGEYYHDIDDGHFTTCPGGFMVGIQARTGAWFNSIAALCATYDPQSHQLQPSAPGMSMGFYGSAGGGLHEKRCPANQAIEYIAFSEFEQKDTTLGIAGAALTVLDEIVFRCRPITAQTESVSDPVIGMTSDDPLEIGGMNTTKPYPSGPGVNAGFTHKERCVDGRLATGLAVAVPGSFDEAPKYNVDGVGGIGLQCNFQPPTPSPPGGSSPPPPPPPPPVQPIDVSGGGSFPLGPQGGGHQTDLYCPTGEAMVALMGSGNANNMDRLALQCAPYAGRTWSGIPQQHGALGNGSFPSGTLSACAMPGAVAAADGDVSSLGGIARLRLHCTNGVTAYMGRNAPNSLETWTHATITCGPGNVARGIYGWLQGSGAVQSFGLHCLPATAFAGAAPGGTSTSGGGGTSGGTGGGTGGSTPSAGLPALGVFTGTWHVTVNTGYSYDMNLTVSGGILHGKYDSGRANGKVSNGLLSGNTLMMDLSQSDVVVGVGKGTFQFADPFTLKGTWTMGPYGGTWIAKR
jgi:hypothetical protein